MLYNLEEAAAKIRHLESKVLELELRLRGQAARAAQLESDKRNIETENTLLKERLSKVAVAMEQYHPF